MTVVVALAACSSPDSKPDRVAGPNPEIAALPLSQHQGTLHPSLQKLVDGSSNSPFQCKALAFCGNLVKIDCESAVDGPLNYYDNRDASVVMHCGGACMVQTGMPKMCTSCPPKEWACREEWQRVERSERIRPYFGEEARDLAAYPAYAPQAVSAMSAAIHGIRTGCRATGNFDESAISREDTGIAVIGADGSVKDLVIFGDDDVSCLEAGLLALRLPPPPRAPFHVMFRLRSDRGD